MKGFVKDYSKALLSRTKNFGQVPTRAHELQLVFMALNQPQREIGMGSYTKPRSVLSFRGGKGTGAGPVSRWRSHGN